MCHEVTHPLLYIFICRFSRFGIPTSLSSLYIEERERHPDLTFI